MAQATDRYEDRRDSPRVPIRVRVRAFGSSDPLAERTGDLSIGGVYFEPADGDTHDLLLRFDVGGRAVTARGEVIAYERQGARVRFTEIDFFDEIAIANSLARHT